MPHPPAWRFRSACDGIEWPGILPPNDALTMSVLYQLEQSQWADAAQNESNTLRQLQRLIAHALQHVPFYRDRLPLPGGRMDAFDMRDFARLPILRRADVQQNEAALHSRHIPDGHGQVFSSRSSGSTGMPVTVLKTQLEALYWSAFTLRDHAWHARDLSGTLCAIRKRAAAHAENWGAATTMLHTGPSYGCDTLVDAESQWRWLLAHRPAYLLSYPSLVGELLSISERTGEAPRDLREVRTFGEPLLPELIERIRSCWNVPASDTYSSEEIGYIALRCPAQPQYHVQSEGVHVEILDPDDQPCRPGESGRVVVTSLHNFAMPLIRYEIGDYATVGGVCACGRSLPTLRRIDGRVRNMLVTADGRKFWPTFGVRAGYAKSLRQFQLVQITASGVELRYVADAELGAADRATLEARIAQAIPAGIAVSFRRVDALPRSAGGKYEDFVNEWRAS